MGVSCERGFPVGEPWGVGTTPDLEDRRALEGSSPPEEKARKMVRELPSAEPGQVDRPTFPGLTQETV